MKTCSKCLIEKSLDSFRKDKSKNDGLYSSCKECKNKYNFVYTRTESCKLSRKKCKEKRKTRADCIQKDKEYRYTYEKNRLKQDPFFKLRKNLRSRLALFIKRQDFRKTNKFLNVLGCSFNDLQIYLEKQFKPGMTWENQGKWHVDHIIPLSSAKNETDMYKLCHYTNLQPLWALDNIRKGNK